MKVRNRYGGREYEVVESLVIKDDNGELYTVEKAAFEEVKPDRWQDVTGECDVNSHGVVFHRNKETLIMAHPDQGYRFRKVRLLQPSSMKTLEGEPCYGERWAFLVERKVD